MKKIVFCLSIVFLSLSSCSENDNAPSTKNDKIIGSWVLHREVDEGICSTIYYYSPTKEESIITFNTDGTISSFDSELSLEFTGTWENIGDNYYKMGFIGIKNTLKIEFPSTNEIILIDEDDPWSDYYVRQGSNYEKYEKLYDESLRTYIPDDNFEKYLISRKWDDVLDNYVKTENIRNVYKMDISNKNISDLTGIENFEGLEELDAHDNNLKYLDISNNCKLNILNVSNNSLACIKVSQQQLDNIPSEWDKSSTLTYSLDCSNQSLIGKTYVPDDNFEQALINLGYDDFMNDYVLTENISTLQSLSLINKGITDLAGIEDFKAIKYLQIANEGGYKHELKSIDISKNTELETLYIYEVDLKSLDVSQNIKITDLRVGSNNLSSLNIVNNTDLSILYLHHNQIESFDISKNSKLVTLSIGDNPLHTLNASNNPNLENLTLTRTKINSLNLSSCPKIKYLSVNSSLLTSMDVSNMSNLSYFDTKSVPTLSCIKVNQTQKSNIPSNWGKDPLQFYSVDCTGLNERTFIPDDNFEGTLISLGYDNKLDDYVFTNNINKITSLVVAKKGISNLTGIEDFRALEELNTSSNNLISLNLSQNPVLRVLDANYNQLTSLNLTQNPNLEFLTCFANSLNSIDLTNNTNLKTLWIDKNYMGFGHSNLSNLNISNCPNLTSILCDNNQLNNFDISKNQYLSNISLKNNKLSQLNTSNCSNLASLDVSNNQITSLNLSNNLILNDLSAHYNNLTSIDVSNNLDLITISLSHNKLTKIDLSKNIKFISIYVDNNLLTSFVLPKLGSMGLKSLKIQNNLQLVNLDISNVIDNSWSFNMDATNTALTCIKISLNVFQNGIPNGWYKDANVYYSTNCP